MHIRATCGTDEVRYERRSVEALSAFLSNFYGDFDERRKQEQYRPADIR
jgi:hypothetical protein